MIKNTIKTYGPLVIVAFAALMAYGISSTKADEPTPSAQDYANLEDIKNNQKVLEATREAHERFMQAKEWNESEVSALAENGWCPKWAEDSDDITLEPCPFQ